MSRHLNIKIISDIVWPWCYVGLRNLEKAGQLTGIKFKIIWEPFYLNGSSMPEEGEDIMEHISKKYGPAMAAKFSKPDNPLSLAGI